MIIKNDGFTIDKLLILFTIAWLLQLKMISNAQFQIEEEINIQINKFGIVSYLYHCMNSNITKFYYFKDNLNITTPTLLYYCCPYLGTLF